MHAIRAALTTAESVATALCEEREADIQTQAQALLHRLAAIRAEVDLLDELLAQSAVKRPEASPRHPRTRP